MATAIVYTGEERVLPPMRIVYEISREPYDLSGYTKITVKFRKNNREILSKTTDTGEGVEVISEVLGKIRVTLTAEETSSLKIGKRQDIEVIVQKPSILRKARFYRSLTVERGF